MLMSSALHHATSSPAIGTTVPDPHRVRDGCIGSGSLPRLPCGGVPPERRDPTP